MPSDPIICIGCGLHYFEGDAPDGVEACPCADEAPLADAALAAAPAASASAPAVPDASDALLPPLEGSASAAGEPASLGCPSCGGSLQEGARACPYCNCTLATQRCGSCSAWNLASAVHCQRCGRRIVAGQAITTAAGGPCPRCQVAIAGRRYADLVVDECDQCGGLFLAEKVMEELVASRSRSAPLHVVLPKRERRAQDKSVVYLKCPVCDEMMNRKVFGRISGVVLDICRHHGVWFDAGELTAVIDFVERGGLDESRTREKQDADRLLEEQSKLAKIPWEQQHRSSWGGSRSFASELARAWLEW